MSLYAFNTDMSPQVCTVYEDIDAYVLYDVLHDPHYRQIWDKHMIHSVDVGYLNPNNDVSYYASEFCCCCYLAIATAISVATVAVLLLMM